MKKLFVFTSGLFSYLSLPLVSLVHAQGTQIADPCADTTGIAVQLCKLVNNNLGKTLQNIVVFFVILTVIISLLYLIYGGVKWITSKGDKTEVEAARNHIIAAIVGLIVVVLAVFIISIILGAFGIKFGQLEIPNITSQ